MAHDLTFAKAAANWSGLYIARSTEIAAIKIASPIAEITNQTVLRSIATGSQASLRAACRFWSWLSAVGCRPDRRHPETRIQGRRCRRPTNAEPSFWLSDRWIGLRPSAPSLDDHWGGLTRSPGRNGMALTAAAPYEGCLWRLGEAGLISRKSPSRKITP